jgi:hypothetical protein
MRTAFRLFVPLTAATVILFVLLGIHVLPNSRVFAIWIVLLTAIALRELVRSFPQAGAGKSRFEAALRGSATPTPERSVSPRIEREFELSLAFADYAHRMLLPLLRTAAAARLSMRHGIELERQRDAARRLLGEETWELVRPDRPPPADGLGPGLREEEIAVVVARLEAL